MIVHQTIHRGQDIELDAEIHITRHGYHLRYTSHPANNKGNVKQLKFSSTLTRAELESLQALIKQALDVDASAH